MEKILHVLNPNHLPTIPYARLVDFQGDLKTPIEPAELDKLRNSLIKHGVFVPKFVWFDEAGKANILDGHQTKQGLASLEADGWTIPEIPYAVVEASSREDAAEKLLQINSRYAAINPQTTWLSTFDFADITAVLGQINLPEFSSLPLTNLQNDSINNSKAIDMKLNEGFFLEIQCQSEEHQCELYQRFQHEGLICRVLTL